MITEKWNKTRYEKIKIIEERWETITEENRNKIMEKFKFIFKFDIRD